MDRPLFTFCVFLHAVFTYNTVLSAHEPGDPLDQHSISQLENRLAGIDSELQQMAAFSMRGGVGAIGFRSASSAKSDQPMWVQIDLDDDHLIDQIALVPTIWRDKVSGFRADSFPLRFDICIGRDGDPDGDPDGEVVAQFGPEDALLPRVAPLIVSLPSPRKASWIRLNVKSLTQRTWDGRYDLQLSEIMVFSGDENVALQQQVTTSADAYQETRSLNKQFLVDGFLPYLMDSRRGERSIAYVGNQSEIKQPEFVIDLGKVQTINQLNLHTTDISDIVPQSENSDFGVPRKIRVEGANKTDFSDAKKIAEYQFGSLYETGPIIQRRFAPVSCRYVKIVAVEPYIDRGIILGFAEIEIRSFGKNVAIHQNVSANFPHSSGERRLSALTDGRNFYGDIISQREWVQQLAKRHDLESERPLVDAALNQRYVKQTSQVQRLWWLAAGLVACTVVLLMASRAFRDRELSRLKERFAADIHDELGANLNAIGLLSDLADATKSVPQEQSGYLRQIRRLSERTGEAARSCTDILQTGELQESFEAEMERAAQRIAVAMEHDLVVDGSEFLSLLGPRTRMDLFLFYKETLVNTCRHSGASKLKIRLTCASNLIQLIVSDNGRGLPDEQQHSVPKSLARRARLLGANVAVDSTESGGTKVELKFRPRRWGLFKRP